MKAVWRKRAWYVADAWRELRRALEELIGPLLIVGWCQASRSHFIEPWCDADDSHSGCECCTWCQDCGRLLGRELVEEIVVP